MNLFFQLFMTFIQIGIKPRELLRELLVCCLGLKPAKDAWRVAAGVEMEEHHTFSHKLDLMITKGSEIFAESIPGAFRWVSARTKSHVISYPAFARPRLHPAGLRVHEADEGRRLVKGGGRQHSHLCVHDRVHERHDFLRASILTTHNQNQTSREC